MALIPPAYLNAVISIGIEKPNEKGALEFMSLATGFLVGKAINEVNDKGEKLYRLFVITNRHVFRDEKTGECRKEVSLRFNTVDNNSCIFKVDLLNIDGTPLWSMHKNSKIDLAVLPASPDAMKQAKVAYYFFRETDIVFAKNFSTKNISTGDGIFVLGFPMSISGKLKNFVIVRQGIIARVDEEVLEDGYYYIDASIYPGNSGGPVIVKPEMVSINGTGSNVSAGLIGIISSGIVYNDIAVSQQTGEPKVIFTEQTGLVQVVPIEYIDEIIDNIIKPITPHQEAKIEISDSEVKNSK